MTEITGALRKMQTYADSNNNVNYTLPIGEQTVDMNDLVGQHITLTHNNAINCVHCNRVTKKSFNQGYCYPCLISLAQCDSCIIKPELCHYHQGTCREPQWGEQNCLQSHFVYLANTGTLKIGITRFVTQGVSSRWMDQGASQAIVVLRVPERRISGLVETVFKKHVADKTNWRTMLKGAPEALDLHAQREQLLNAVEDDLAEIAREHGLTSFSPATSPAHSINYPVARYPIKIKSINLDKTPSFSGVLEGIKGQYLLLDEERVINVRKYSGYNCTLTM